MITEKRIVISGTYWTWKSTTTQELGKLTWIELSVARWMREILPELFPWKKLEECNPQELLELWLARFWERVKQESLLEKKWFISDWSALHEWAYWHARQLESTGKDWNKIDSPEFHFWMNTYGNTVKRYAKWIYTDIIHLPIEFPIPNDWHRPVSEDFREVANRTLLETWEKLWFRVHVVWWSINERINKIVDLLQLKISSTRNWPEIRNDWSLYYEDIDDILWDWKERFFTQWFKNVDHKTHDITLNADLSEIKCLLDLVYTWPWSSKDWKQCTPHLSSIDVVRVTGQLSQALLYSLDKVSRNNVGNFTLRNLELKAWNKLVEDSSRLKASVSIIETKILNLRWKRFRTAKIESNVEGFDIVANVAYELLNKK